MLENSNNFMQFQKVGGGGGKGEEGKVVGSIRPGPFAKGAFRYAFFGVISEGLGVGGTRGGGGEKVVMKHLMDVYQEEEGGGGGGRGKEGVVGAEGGELGDLGECGVGHLVGKRVVEEYRKRGVEGGRVEMVSLEVLEWGAPKLVCFVFVFCFLFFV